MRALLPLVVSGAMACGGNLYQSHQWEDTDDTADTGLDDTGLNGNGNGNGHTDTDTDTDSDTDTDTDTGPPPDPCHPYDPMDWGSWTRTYDIKIGDRSGTETQNRGGPGFAPDGTPLLRVQTTVSDLDMSFDLMDYTGWNGWYGRDCNYGIGQGGYRIADNITYNTLMMGPVAIEGQDLPPIRYLPHVDQLGSGMSWVYDQNRQFNVMGIPVDTPISGTFTEHGLSTVVVPAGSFSGWRMTHVYTEDRTAWPALGGDVRHVTAELVYVNGLGLVFERAENTHTGELYLERRLRSYTGLSPG